VLVGRECDGVGNERELIRSRRVAGVKVWEKVREVIGTYVNEGEFSLEQNAN
jgi:hypothetical protein